MGILTEDWSTETLWASLWFLQPWGIKDNCRGWGGNRSHQKPSKLSATGQKEISTVSSEISLPTWGQGKALYTKGKVMLWSAQSPMSPGNLLLVILAALTCASAMNACEHMYWSYVLHSPLFQLVDRMSSVPVIFIMTLCLCSDLWPIMNSCIHSSEKKDYVFFSLVFVSFLIYIGCHHISVLIKRQTWTYFYKVPELLIRWVFFKLSSRVFCSI